MVDIVFYENENIKIGRKLTINYAVMQSFFWMGGCCVLCFASVFLSSRGFSNTEIGTTLAVANVLAIIFQPILATFADKTTRVKLKTIVAFLAIIAFVTTLLLSLLPSIFVVTAVLFMMLTALVRIQQSFYTALAMEHIAVGVPLNFSLGRGVGSAAFAATSILLGKFSEEIGAWIIMPVNLVFVAVSIFLLFKFQAPKEHSDNKKVKTAIGFFEFALRNKRFLLVVFSLVLMYFSHVLINTYTIQIIENVGGTKAEMGIASAVGGLVELPAMALFPWILKKIKSAGTIMKLAGIFFVVKIILTWLAPNVMWIYIAQSLQFFAYALLLPATVYYVTRTINSADKIKGQSCMDLSMSISGIAGNLLGGVLLDFQGVSFMLIVGIVVSSIGAVILPFATEKDKAV